MQLRKLTPQRWRCCSIASILRERVVTRPVHLVPEQWRYFLLVALLAKEARERLPLSMPRLPAPIRPRKYYAQVDTPPTLVE